MNLEKLIASVNAQKQAIEARKASGTKIAKLPGGTSRWRILPGWREEDPYTFGHSFGQHYIKDETGKVVAVYLCEWDTFEKACDICGPLREAIRSTRDDKTLEQLKEFNSGKRILVNAVQISGAGFDTAKAGEPVLLGLPIGVHDSYVNLLHTALLDEVNILDLKEGRDIVIDKTGTGLMTRYSVAQAAKSTAIDPAVMTKITNIDAFIEAEKTKSAALGVKPLNDQIARIMGGTTVVRSASLVAPGSSAAAAALAPPPAALEKPVLETPAVVAKPVVAAATPATSDFDASLGDDDLDALLDELK